MRKARLGKKFSIGNHIHHATLRNVFLLEHCAICVSEPGLLTLHPCFSVPCTHVESSSQEGVPHEQCMQEIQAPNECMRLHTASAAAEAQQCASIGCMFCCMQ